jgi:CubicO group peptidase (beta-lactamase class C family)
MVTLNPNGKEALDNLVAKVVQEQKIPGFVFGATSVDEEIYFKGGGYNVVNNPASGEVNEDSVFWICSQSKMIIHLAALKLVEQRRITFESPVSDYLPEFADLVIIDDQMADNLTYKPANTIMRLKHLLNFTSGLFYPLKGLRLDQQLVAYAAPHNKENPISEFISIIKGGLPGIPLLFEPGENFAYGWSSDILGFVVEKVSRQTLDEYLQENIFKPLVMKASFYLTPDIKANLVDLAYRRNGNMEAWANQSLLIEQDPTKVARHMGGVGLYASLKDYLNLLRHLLQINAGKATNPIVSAETVRSLFEPALNEEGTKSVKAFMSIDPFSPPDSSLQWSTAMAVCTSDWPGRR